jgi:hypothetical protein
MQGESVQETDASRQIGMEVRATAADGLMGVCQVLSPVLDGPVAFKNH